MKFITVSGSAYEVDIDKKNIRRLSGAENPTPRQGKDGDWRAYAAISPIEINYPVLIVWREGELLSGSPENALPSTQTSFVVKIDE